MNVYLLILIVYFSVFLVTAFILNFAKRKADPATRRAKELMLEATGKSSMSMRHKTKQAINREIAPMLEKALSIIGGVSGSNEKSDQRLRNMLQQAGLYLDKNLRMFKGIKISCALASLAGFAYVRSVWPQPLQLTLLWGILVFLVFFQLPDFLLQSKIKARQSQLGTNLPDALDLLVISVEAGLGLNAAILRVGKDLALTCRSLSEELLRVNQDMRTGMPRDKALRDMSDRNKVEDLKILVGALIMADKLGTSIADTLRAQADSLRTRIKQRAEEQAAKAGIKLLLPLVLFILPALFLVLLGPAFISMMDTLWR